MQYSGALLCLDAYSITFLIIRRTKPTDKLQFQTLSPAIPHFEPCKYNPRNKIVSVLGCACILAARPF